MLERRPRADFSLLVNTSNQLHRSTPTQGLNIAQLSDLFRTLRLPAAPGAGGVVVVGPGGVALPPLHGAATRPANSNRTAPRMGGYATSTRVEVQLTAPHDRRSSPAPALRTRPVPRPVSARPRRGSAPSASGTRPLRRGA